MQTNIQNYLIQTNFTVSCISNCISATKIPIHQDTRTGHRSCKSGLSTILSRDISRSPFYLRDLFLQVSRLLTHWLVLSSTDDSYISRLVQIQTQNSGRKFQPSAHWEPQSDFQSHCLLVADSSSQSSQFLSSQPHCRVLFFCLQGAVFCPMFL